MGKRLAAAALAFVMATGQGWAAGVCERPADFSALRVAAMQQEMMVAALACHAIDAYNDFVLSHREALQQSDHVLMAFFETANARTGFDDYNLYKTELANGASMRSIRDGRFCEQLSANFRAAHGHTLDEALAALPYPVGTGTVHCPLLEAAANVSRRPAAEKDSWPVSANAARP